MNDATPDDSELLRRFAVDRSEAAFTAFVGRRIDFVHGAALRRTLGDAHLAGEIAQAVFLIAFRKAPALARHSHLAGWLHTTTGLVARRLQRDARLRRQREQEAAVSMSEIQDNTAATAAARAQMRDILDEALDRLATKDRETLLLRFFEARTFAEIALATKTSEDAARMRVSRALDKLRVLFARRGVSTTAVALGTFITGEAATATAPAGLAGIVSGAIFAGGGATIISATAVSAALTSGGILAFMTSTKLAVISIVTALLVTTLVVVEMRREKDAANNLAALKREHAELLKSVSANESRVKDYRTSLESLRQRKAEAAEAVKNPANPVAAGRAFLAAHPEVKTMLVDLQKSNVAGRFYHLYKELNLTPEQIAEFEELTAKFQIIGGQTFNKNIPGFGNVRFTTIPEVVTYEEYFGRLHALLGRENAILVRNDFILRKAQRYSENLAYNLYYTDTPLTADQGARINNLFNTVVETRKSENETWINVERVNWDLALKQCSEFLSEPQMAVLEQIRAQEDWSRTAAQLTAAMDARQSDANTANKEEPK